MFIDVLAMRYFFVPAKQRSAGELLPLGEHTICSQIIVCYNYTRELVNLGLAQRYEKILKWVESYFEGCNFLVLDTIYKVWENPLMRLWYVLKEYRPIKPGSPGHNLRNLLVS